MNLEEAKNRYSELSKVCAMLPDETNITKDEWGNYNFRFSLTIGQTLGEEIVRELKETIFTGDYITYWYRSLHNQLVQSEVNYRIKMQKNKDESI
jgi:hypothetical protein